MRPLIWVSSEMFSYTVPVREGLHNIDTQLSDYLRVESRPLSQESTSDEPETVGYRKLILHYV